RNNCRTSAVLRVSHLPLVRSALQSVTSVYSEVKGRYPLLGLMGGVAEVRARSISQVAMRRATPLLQSLEPQIEVANNLALVGLDRLERNFPILNQSADEVMGHLVDALFLTLDDVHVRVVGGLDGALDWLERLAEAARAGAQWLQDSEGGQAAASVLGRLEDSTATYLPLPPTMREYRGVRVQGYEEEDEGDEPSVRTRARRLLLSLGLQLYHRLVKVREQLRSALGLRRVLELVGGLLQYLRSLLVALLCQAQSLRELTLNRVRGQAVMLAELSPVRQVRELPVQIQQLLQGLQELSKILLQLLINATPLYSLVKQEVEEFLNQENIKSNSSSHRILADSLSCPRRLSSQDAQGSGGLWGPDCRSSLKEPLAPETEGSPVPSNDGVQHQSLATEVLLMSLKQFVAQSQAAFEYMNPETTDPTRVMLILPVIL
uniref:Perilipin 6 n=1 Tax=Monopterus albus TaxID=43700 RepID=A0A3Q3QYR4_MONAL